jgi:hypothetical protein
MDEWLDMDDCRKAEEIIRRVGCKNALMEIVVSLGAKAAAMCVDVYHELCKKTTSTTSEAGLPQTRKAARKGIVIDLDETASLDISDISFTPTPADILFLCALFEYDANEIAEAMHRMIDELMRGNKIDIVKKLFIPSDTDIRSVISEIEKIYRSKILDTVKKCRHYSSLF